MVFMFSLMMSYICPVGGEGGVRLCLLWIDVGICYHRVLMCSCSSWHWQSLACCVSLCV